MHLTVYFVTARRVKEQEAHPKWAASEEAQLISPMYLPVSSRHQPTNSTTFFPRESPPSPAAGTPPPPPHSFPPSDAGPSYLLQTCLRRIARTGCCFLPRPSRRSTGRRDRPAGRRATGHEERGQARVVPSFCPARASAGDAWTREEEAPAVVWYVSYGSALF
jgi:hypothetical protein